MISTKGKNSLKAKLKIYSVFKNTLDSTNFNTEIFISIKKDLVDFLVEIMPNNKCSYRVKRLLNNKIYSLIYDKKTTKLSKFLNPNILYID